MEETPLARVCEAVEEAHAKIQEDFADINPIIGVSKQMRNIGIATDVMTIDCLKSGMRILLVFHDAQPGVASYQFCLRDEDPSDEFETLAIESLTAEQFYDWMKDRFSIPAQEQD